MLDFFRKNANSMALKIFLSVLALTFILGFGIGDIIRKLSGQDFAIKFGSYKVSKEHFVNLQQQKIHTIKKLSKDKNLTQEEYTQVALHHILRDIILNYSVQDLGFNINNNVTKKFIQMMPFFTNKEGYFDSKLLQSMLGTLGLTEQDFIEYQKQDLNKMFIQAPMNLLSVNKQLDTFIKNDTELRSIDLVEIFTSGVNDNSPITEEEINDFYSKNLELYKLPQRRSFYVLTLNEDDLKKEAKFTDEELHDFHQTSIYKDQEYSECSAHVLEEKQREYIDNKLNEITTKIEDELLANKDPQKVATQYNLQINKHELVSQTNTTIDNKTAISNSYAVHILDKVFNEDDTPPCFTTVQAANAVVHFITVVTQTQQSKTAQLETVKQEVINECKRIKNAKLTEKIANDLQHTILSAKTFEQKKQLFENFRKQNNYTTNKIENFTRKGPTAEKNYKLEGLTKKIVKSSFEIAVGDVCISPFAGGFSVAQLTNIKDGEKITDEQQQQYKTELTKHISDDMFDCLFAYLEQKHQLKINEKNLKNTASNDIKNDDL